MTDLMFKLIVGGVFMYALYVFMFKKDVFSFGTSIKDYIRRKNRRRKVKHLSYILEKSNSIKEIEFFLLSNIGYLFKDIIIRMNNRVEYLQALDIIGEDDKFRVEPVLNGTTMKERTGKSFQERCMEASEEIRTQQVDSINK